MMYARLDVFDEDDREVGWVMVPIFEHRTNGHVGHVGMETVTAFGYELELHRPEPGRAG